MAKLEYTAEIKIKDTDVIAKRGGLAGFVYGDKREKFKDGESTGTSPVKLIEKRAGVQYVTTESGAVYKVTTIPEAEWTKLLEAEVDNQLTKRQGE